MEKVKLNVVQEKSYQSLSGKTEDQRLYPMKIKLRNQSYF